ncbi:aspartic peptidase domain-containing protein [Dendryphion nanum]|uniref:Aspartic peptidase domain-containing protein n=1 Tax=Dendryphion nanum TaxID=256645 RepID=A0A9P9CY92_9PLEO|nr:aspartic peptidase domain-containing protein [Dendryphion nanum]
MTNITLANSTYTLVIDTGFSDTWVAGTKFQCLTRGTRHRLPQSACAFGKLYDPATSPTYQEIRTHSFSTQYTDGEFLSGEMGSEDVGIGGIFLRQTIGVVARGWWIGDGISSGLIGLAFPSLASNVLDLGYSSLMFTLFENESITVPPIFSLALNRPSVLDPIGGGLLALGGIPDVPIDGPFVSVPISPLHMDTYAFYAIPIDGIAVAPPGYDPETELQLQVRRRKQSSQKRNDRVKVFPLRKSLAPPSSNSTEASPEPGFSSTTFNSDGTQPQDAPLTAILDSGTTLVYLPPEISAYIASSFDPPGFYNSVAGMHIVECNAKVPVVGVIIAGRTFWMDERDLLGNGSGEGGGQEKSPLCILAIQSHRGLDAVLGDAWLKGVVVVFDVGERLVRIAARAAY